MRRCAPPPLQARQPQVVPVGVVAVDMMRERGETNPKNTSCNVQASG